MKRPMICGFCGNGDHSRCPGGVRNGDGSIVLCACRCEYAGKPRCTDCQHRAPEDIGPDWTCIEKDGCQARLAKRQLNNPTLLMIRKVRTEVAKRQAREAKVERQIIAKSTAKAYCRCCGKQTKGGNFLPGHDTRFLGQLITSDDIGNAREVAYSISPAFGNKFDKRTKSLYEGN